MQAARSEGFDQRDGERRLPCPTGGKIADADDRPAKPANRLEAGAQLQIAQREAEPVDGHQRPKQRTRGGCGAHGVRSSSSCLDRISFSKSVKVISDSDNPAISSRASQSRSLSNSSTALRSLQTSLL